MFIFITLVATLLFVAGIFSLRTLGQIEGPTGREKSEPLFTPIALLFSTSPRGPDFRRRQRLTIWLFCGSILLLYIARRSF